MRTVTVSLLRTKHCTARPTSWPGRLRCRWRSRRRRSQWWAEPHQSLVVANRTARRPRWFDYGTARLRPDRHPDTVLSTHPAAADVYRGHRARRKPTSAVYQRHAHPFFRRRDPRLALRGPPAHGTRAVLHRGLRHAVVRAVPTARARPDHPHSLDPIWSRGARRDRSFEVHPIHGARRPRALCSWLSHRRNDGAMSIESSPP